MGSITARAYGDQLALESADDLDAVSDLLDQDCDFVWVDLDDPAPSQLQHLADELGLHHLSVEDALDPHQRDKYVHYDRHVFLVCHALELDLELAALTTTELDLFIGDRWLITVHSGRQDLIDRFVARWERSRQLGGRTVGFAVYGILDVVVDGYFGVIDQFEAFYDEVADHVFADMPIEPSGQRRWFEMRRALNQFDRIIGPLAEALRTVVDQDLDRFPDAAAPYLRDIEGEIASASIEVDSLRELVNHIVDANLVLRGYHQGVITKKITSWAAIIAVPTLVTGYYGMNVPYPGSGETWGVVTATALSLGCSGALYVLFRRLRWI